MSELKRGKPMPIEDPNPCDCKHLRARVAELEAVIEEVGEWGEGKRQIIDMSYVIDRDDGEWREHLDGWDELDAILEKARGDE